MKNILILMTSLYTLSGLATPFSVGEPNSKWNKLAIDVCWWGDNSINVNDFNRSTLDNIRSIGESDYIDAGEVLKSKIRNLIQKEYTPVRTGIHFVGWKECKDSPNSDLEILVGRLSNRTFGQATIGMLAEMKDEYTRRERNEKGFVYINLMDRSNIKLSAEESILGTALHEFGHVAGLRHEHILGNTSENKCTLFNERPNKGTAVFSAYDPSSIMDYCLFNFTESMSGSNFYVKMNPEDGQLVPNPKLPVVAFEIAKRYSDETIFARRKINKDLMEFKLRIGLSKGDIHGLRCLYVYQPSEFTNKCKKDYRP